MFGNMFKYEKNLFYKIDKRTKNWSCCNNLTPNKETGYMQVSVNRKTMLLHRLVYFFHHQDWDIFDISKENEIDHIYENKLDNSIENLRITNHSENNQNRTHINGKPIKGICFEKRKKPWRAYWFVDKKRKSKSFKTEIEALEYRKKMVEIHYSHHPSKRNNKLN